MSKSDDEQYRKLSKNVSNTHCEREYNHQIEKLTDRGNKNSGRRR